MGYIDVKNNLRIINEYRVTVWSYIFTFPDDEVTAGGPSVTSTEELCEEERTGKYYKNSYQSRLEKCFSYSVPTRSPIQR
jgi:hypothetical protein